MNEFNTNSPIGSQHWFNTLLGNVLNMGWMIADRSTDDLLIGYGKHIEGVSRFLMQNYEQIQNQNFVEFQEDLNRLLSKYTENENNNKKCN